MNFTNNYGNGKYLLRYFLFCILPSNFRKYILSQKYIFSYNRKPNFNNPQYLSEKLQWLKLYENNPLKTNLSDKLYAKEYVKNLVPLINVAKVYDKAKSFQKLDLTKCPNKFILKTNHSWKTNIVIQDKSSLSKKQYNEYKKYYENAMKINYAYWAYYEMQYKNIIPYIFAEEYLGEEKSFKEYEAYCFNGKVEFINVVCNQEDKNGNLFASTVVFDNKLNKLDFSISIKHIDSDSFLLPFLEDVLNYSNILCKNLNFVRIDFIETDNKLYFMEFTFTPYSGFIKFIPSEFDLILGDKLNLSKL